MNKAKYLFNTYEQSKISTPKAKPKPKFVMTSYRVQVVCIFWNVLEVKNSIKNFLFYAGKG